jgi:molybdopterin synthase sulfur carrier subunit
LGGWAAWQLKTFFNDTRFFEHVSDKGPNWIREKKTVFCPGKRSSPDRALAAENPLPRVDTKMGATARRLAVTMEITLKLAPSLSDLVGNKEKLFLSIEQGASLEKLLKMVSDEYPAFKAHGLYTPPNISDDVIIFINGDNVRHLNYLDTELKSGDMVYIIPLLAGG